MVNVEIDGKKVQASEGMMVIEAADEAGIYIPRFCYHKKLSIAANCRMCLVEIEKLAKEVPACATPVTDGMKIFTRSPKAIAAQKSVMEFLLINHPLDCPICDQGGECELQDIAMGYGGDVSAFTERKRVVENKDFGPLITGDMTRCIHCTRCVRFGEEIAGIKELGATGRGEHMEIGTYIQHSLVSEMSGNVIDLCPVGALTSKPFRFKARAWEIIQHNTIAPHDCIGSNLLVHTFRNEVIRVVPQENEAINETWLSDRDRFSYEALNSEQRLTTPMVKVDGEWQEVDWSTALERVANGVKEVIKEKGADALAAIASPSSTVEELYLLQKLLRALGCGNIDHRLMQTDFSDQDSEPLCPGLGQRLGDLESLESLLLVGSNVRRDQPIAGHRLRKATMRGTAISCINPVDYDFYFPVQSNIIVPPSRMPAELAAVLKALSQQTSRELPQPLARLLAGIDVTDTHQAIARSLLNADAAAVLMGHDVITHAHSASIRTLVRLIAELSGATQGLLSDGGNAAGAWLSGAVPHRGPAGATATAVGRSLGAMVDAELGACLLLGVEPENDIARSARALAALEQAGFVVAMHLYKNPAALGYADVLLPVSPFTETSGTFVNAQGDWQSFEGVVQPRGDARPAWKVLRVLGNLLDCEGFDYLSSQEVRDELKALADAADFSPATSDQAITGLKGIDGLESIADRHLYRGDAIQRHAPSLQCIDVKDDTQAGVNTGQLAALKLGEGDSVKISNGQQEAILRVQVDERVPDNAVLVAQSVFGAETADPEHNRITLTRVEHAG